MPSLKDGTLNEPENLSRRIHDYCQERWDNRKHEWETHKTTLNSIIEKKEKQYQCDKYKLYLPQVHWGSNQTLIWSQLTHLWVVGVWHNDAYSIYHY